MIDTSTLDPSLYPKSYRTPLGKGFIRTIGFIFIFIFTVLARTSLSSSYPTWLIVYFVLVLLILTCVILNQTFASTTLYVDRIESKTLFGKRVMMRDQISGWRFQSKASCKSLEYKNDEEMSFLLPTGIKNDAAWDAWMADIPDLAGLDEKNILDDVRDYPKLGATEEERVKRWNLTNQIAFGCWIITWIATALIFMGLFFQIIPIFIGQIGVWLVILVPWVTILNMYIFGSHFSGLAKRTPEIWNNLSQLFSGMMLGIFGIIYPITVTAIPIGAAHILYLIAGPLCGLVLLAAQIIILRTIPQRKDSLGGCLVVMFLGPIMLLTDCGYGIGAALQINTTLDYSNPKGYAVTVLETPVLTNVTVRLKLSSWGGHPESHLEQTRSSLGAVSKDQTLCVWLHSGLLGIPWYTVTHSFLPDEDNRKNSLNSKNFEPCI